MRIWKYEVRGGQPIDMPQGARILAIQNQQGKPVIWAAIDEDKPTEPRTFVVYGTGWKIDEPAENYIGTYQTLGGQLVWHVFERK